MGRVGGVVVVVVLGVRGVAALAGAARISVSNIDESMLAAKR